MSKSFDFKSFVIGGLLVLVVLCAMGAVPFMDHTYYGRFTIVTVASENWGIYSRVLDTATGQVWMEQPQVIDFEFRAPKLEGLAPAEPNL
jgi:hypothetical protein